MCLMTEHLDPIRCFKIFIVVKPREGLAVTSPAKPSFGMTLTLGWYTTVITNFILQPVSYQKKEAEVNSPLGQVTPPEGLAEGVGQVTPPLESSHPLSGEQAHGRTKETGEQGQGRGRVKRGELTK